MEEIMKKIQKKRPIVGFYDAFQPEHMDMDEKLSYLRKLDREFPGFGFCDAFVWYQKKKSINHHRSMDKNRKEKLLCEIFRIENSDVIEGYENVLGYH